jgi:hypothetical protein
MGLFKWPNHSVETRLPKQEEEDEEAWFVLNMRATDTLNIGLKLQHQRSLLCSVLLSFLW